MLVECHFAWHLSRYPFHSLANMHRQKYVYCAVALCGMLGFGCATEKHRTVAVETVASYQTNYNGPRYSLVVGKFRNGSSYMQGIFSTGGDQLGTQAKTILKTHLQQTNRFSLMDRDSMEEIAQESAISGQQQDLKGAAIAITGDVTEFGRKETGDKQLFGLFGRGKTQTAYSKVSLNIVDVRTSEIVYSVQGAGEYELNSREVVGFGSTAGYDSTLNGKVLNFAITDAVNKLVVGLEQGQWGPSRTNAAAQ